MPTPCRFRSSAGRWAFHGVECCQVQTGSPWIPTFEAAADLECDGMDISLIVSEGGSGSPRQVSQAADWSVQLAGPSRFPFSGRRPLCWVFSPLFCSTVLRCLLDPFCMWPLLCVYPRWDLHYDDDNLDAVQLIVFESHNSNPILTRFRVG